MIKCDAQALFVFFYNFSINFVKLFILNCVIKYVLYICCVNKNFRLIYCFILKVIYFQLTEYKAISIDYLI